MILVSFPVVLGGLDAVNAGFDTPMDSVVGGLSYALVPCRLRPADYSAWW